MSLTLRTATPADMAGVASIYDHYVVTSTVTFELTPPGEAVWADKLATLQGAGWPFLVADLDGTVAGFAYVGPWRPRPAYAHTVEDTIYLDPAYAGRGVGTALLGALLDACARAGVRQVVSVVADVPEAAGSLPLHRRFGFAEAGRLTAVGFKHGRWVDTILLQRSL